MKGMNETLEKRFDTLNEKFDLTKSELDGRIDVFEHLEGKIDILADENRKSKVIHEEYRKKILEENGKTNMTLETLKTDFQTHVGEYQATFLNNQFFMDK